MNFNKRKFIKALKINKLLKWIYPHIRKRRLLSKDNKKISLGAAIGAFYAVLIPIGQIPFALMTSYLLKANILAASITTFLSNPVTYIPFYLIAYQIGYFILSLFLTVSVISLGYIGYALSLVVGVITFASLLSTTVYFVLRLYFYIRELL